MRRSWMGFILSIKSLPFVLHPPSFLASHSPESDRPQTTLEVEGRLCVPLGIDMDHLPNACPGSPSGPTSPIPESPSLRAPATATSESSESQRSKAISLSEDTDHLSTCIRAPGTQYTSEKLECHAFLQSEQSNDGPCSPPPHCSSQCAIERPLTPCQDPHSPPLKRTALKTGPRAHLFMDPDGLVPASHKPVLPLHPTVCPHPSASYQETPSHPSMETHRPFVSCCHTTVGRGTPRPQKSIKFLLGRRLAGRNGWYCRLWLSRRGLNWFTIPLARKVLRHIPVSLPALECERILRE